MPGNDFEKQVQQKMDELQFAPSAAVWQEVEAKLAPRRRRRLFFWLPLLLVVAGAGWWWIGSQSNTHSTAADAQKPAALTINEHQDDNPVPSANQRVTTNENKPEPGSETQPLSEMVLSLSHPKTHGLPAEITRESRQQPHATAKTAPAASFAPFIGGGLPKEQIKRGRTVPRRPELLQDRSLPLPAKDDADATESKADSSSDALIGNPGIQITLHGYTISFDANRMNAIVVNEPISQQPGVPAAAPLKKPVQPKKIQWRMEANAGWTNTISDFPGGIGRTPVFNSQVVYANNSASGNVFGGSNATGSSDLRPSAGFSLGILAKRSINKRYSIVAGLRYSHYAASMTTGSRIDTANVQTFRTGTQYNFTNIYRLLEIPVHLEHTLGQYGRWKGSAGLVAGWVLSSNTVHYNIAGGTYKDASATQQRFQYGIELGLRYQLLRDLPAFQVGPSFRYGLSKLSAQAYDGGQHLFFGGISIRYWPSKK